MTFLEFTASENDNDRRLDRIIRKFIDAQNLSGIYRAIRKGFVKVNGKKMPPETHIFSGDKIKIARFLISQEDEDSDDACKATSDDNAGDTIKDTKTNESLKICPFPYKIIFKNEDMLVLHKPCGVSVHGSEHSLEKEVRRLFKMSSGSSSLSFVPGPVHRLDKNTSGLIAFSWSIKGAHWFSNALARHEIHKTYLGIASGILKEERRWEDFISDNKEDVKNNKVMGNERFHTVFASFEKENSASKQAFTTVTPLAYGEYKENPVTVIQYKIETGRTHQIRAQSALHNLPLIGDTAYGAEKIPFAEFFLHAQKLEMPKDNAIALPAVLQAELPKEFKEFLTMCGIHSIS